MVLRDQRTDFVNDRLGALRRQRQREIDRREQVKLPPREAAAAEGEFQRARQIKLYERVAHIKSAFGDGDGALVFKTPKCGARVAAGVYARLISFPLRRILQNQIQIQVGVAAQSAEIKASALPGKGGVVADLQRLIERGGAAAGRAHSAEAAEKVAARRRGGINLVFLNHLRMRGREQKRGRHNGAQAEKGFGACRNVHWFSEL